jgi:hypothetical protein
MNGYILDGKHALVGQHAKVANFTLTGGIDIQAGKA